MKLISLTFVALTVLNASTALAQSIAIGAPTKGETIYAGKNFTVDVERPDTLTGSTEVALVIALQSCYEGRCIDLSEFLGTILYQGPFDPQFQQGYPESPPHQNFSVQTPSTFRGKAQLGVVQFSLVGASEQPFLQIVNTTLNVVG